MLTLQIYTVKVQLIQCKVYSVSCNSAAVMVYCLFGRIRSELDWMSKLRWKYYTGNFGQREKMLYFLWKYYLQCTLALQKKKNYDEKMMVFWTFSRSFQSCSNSPIALLFSVGIVVYILVMIYYYPVSCLMIWSVFIKKKSRRSLRNRGKEKIQNSNYNCFAITKQEGPDICFDTDKMVDLFYETWFQQKIIVLLINGNKFKRDRIQHNSNSNFVSANFSLF